MIYLTAEQVLFIHSRLVAETGGSTGVRDSNLLLSAIEQPKATFDQQDLYPDVFSKAAALMFSLVNNHPFVDGNKRTGITAAIMFLQLNGYALKAPPNEIFTFTQSVSKGKISTSAMTDWFFENCAKNI